MQTVLIVIHLMVVMAMIGLILLQRSEGGGLGMGSSGGGVFTSRGSSNVLTRTTAILALVFFCTSLALSMLAGYDRQPSSILDGGATRAPAGSPAPPIDSGQGGLLDQLRQQGEQGQPAQQPSGPQAPNSR